MDTKGFAYNARIIEMIDMMEEPKCIREGYAYINRKTEEWCIKDDAPDWARKEFEEFLQAATPGADDNGIVTAY